MSSLGKYIINLGMILYNWVNSQGNPSQCGQGSFCEN